MFIEAAYYYYGSTNCSIRFVEGDTSGTIKLLTDFGEVIATVSDISELQTVLNNLKEDKYA